MKRLILLLALACDLEAATVNFSGMSYDTVTGILTATASGNATAAQGAKADSALQTASSANSFPTLNQNTSGSSASCTGNAATVTTNANLTGDVTSVGNATTIGAGKVTDAMRIETSAATSATTGTMTVSMSSDIVTITPTGACTFNASGGRTGRIVTFSITTSGVSSFTLTFGTNFRKTGTLATGTTSARFFAVTFRCIDGTIWQEICRTAVQT